MADVAQKITEPTLAPPAPVIKDSKAPAGCLSCFGLGGPQTDDDLQTEREQSTKIVESASNKEMMKEVAAKVESVETELTSKVESAEKVVASTVESAENGAAAITEALTNGLAELKKEPQTTEKSTELADVKPTEKLPETIYVRFLGKKHYHASKSCRPALMKTSADVVARKHLTPCAKCVSPAA
eukprot:CAMPEP_0184656698 /NCGR_PEP_ID=MMETSP0308-20130426/16693_1 /TAXON_ID=38269 /ORGANISM="Gloeochaete witrockiana, Strain SAG 46.84" /LENGTH=184 /DNA_ID=CAMNT_0027093941 /DNA_START=157 /DNA_END=711 /DNA_ORIENTATION=-